MTNTERLAHQRLSGILAALDNLGAPRIEYSESPYFGDYVIQAIWREIELRLVRDKDVETVEIRPGSVDGDWFDLPLVMAFLTGDESLENFPIDEQVNRFSAHLPEVLSALWQNRWPTTRSNLELLQKRRAESRFGLS